MSLFLQALKTKDIRTENDMPTHSTSGSGLVDFFGLVGGARKLNDIQITNAFGKAFSEDADKAMKLLFWARDVRGGAGERRAFRVILHALAKYHPEALRRNLKYVPEYGRWDDLLELVDTSLERDAFDVIVNGLREGDRLCAKWMPRKGLVAAKLRDYAKLTPKQFRKLLVHLTHVVETPMCKDQYSKIEYDKLPSLAAARYQNAFRRHDPARYEAYIASLKSGEAKINAGAIYPYDIVRSLFCGQADVADEQWKALPDYMEGSEFQRILPLVDTSGSMTCRVSGQITALDVAVSLGIYLSERNRGVFKDHFLTFSERPQLQHLTGKLSQRVRQLRTAHWEFTTNLLAAFDQMLRHAQTNAVPVDEMPQMVMILSDMQFDHCIQDRNDTALQGIRKRYAAAGYSMPKVIFWNINGRADQSPVQVRDRNTAIVSGFSPSIMKYVLNQSNLEKLTPYGMMMEVVNSPRYAAIAA
jgi:hypothetical protein